MLHVSICATKFACGDKSKRLAMIQLSELMISYQSVFSEEDTKTAAGVQAWPQADKQSQNQQCAHNQAERQHPTLF
jgi:hypothetical protein